MLVIRDAQMDVFAKASKENLRARLAAHLRDVYPARTLDLSPSELDERIAREIEKAAIFGLTSDRDLFLHIGLCGAFGFEFLEKPEHAWMKRVLADARISSPQARLRYLFDLCRQHQDAAEQSRQVRNSYLEAR